MNTQTPESRDVTVTGSEYADVRAPESMTSLFRDSYEPFGWTVEDTVKARSVRPLPLLPAVRSSKVTMRMRRSRGIKNRAMVVELQRSAERSLGTITRLARSPKLYATIAAVTLGLIGVGLLAPAVFILQASFTTLGFVLGITGLVFWLAGGIAYFVIKSRRTTRVAPEIEREHQLVIDAGAQAARLLR